MSFRLVPKSVTWNDLERRNGVILRHFSEFGYLTFRAYCVKVHVRYFISWWVLAVTVIHCESKKTRHYNIVHNFDKCLPIFKLLSLTDSLVNLQQNLD